MKVKRRILKSIIDAMKSVPCEDCGKQYPPHVMDFDHLYNKKINIAEIPKRWTSVFRLFAEINKCDVVCSNCHRVRTYIRRKRKMDTEKKKMTRDEITAMLKARVRKDGTPFRKHEGPRKRRTVTPEGLQVALTAVADEAGKLALVRAFGADGRAALKALVEKDNTLSGLLSAAFPHTGGGRPYQDAIKTTVDGKAIVSGFDSSAKVSVTRNSDGSVLLVPLESSEAALDDAEKAIVA